MTDMEFLAAAGMLEDEVKEQKAMPHYTLIRKNGEAVDIQEQTEGLYSNGDMFFKDAGGRLYKKDLWSTRVFICEPSGEPSHTVGEIDAKKLVADIRVIPCDKETGRTTVKWGRFPAGTHIGDIWIWIEKEFGVCIAELMKGGKEDEGRA